MRTKIPSRKKCPRCNQTHSIEMFGLRKMHHDDKHKVAQSQCKKCRTKSPIKPRKKVTKKIIKKVEQNVKW